MVDLNLLGGAGGQQALANPQHRIHVLASLSHSIVSTTHYEARTSLLREQLFLAV
jgi:hypothetical protein